MGFLADLMLYGQEIFPAQIQAGLAVLTSQTNSFFIGNSS